MRWIKRQSKISRYRGAWNVQKSRNGKGGIMTRTIAIWAIAICYLANTIQVYDAEGGGINVYFGSFGWHFEQGIK